MKRKGIMIKIEERFKVFLILSVLFFSFVLIFPSNIWALAAEYGTYEDVSNDWDTFWEKFSTKNSEYWETFCSGIEDEDDATKCKSVVLKYQEKFYKKLYNSLADYEKNGLFIYDDVILETVFLDLTPDWLSDSANNDNSTYEDFINTDKNSYVLEEDVDTVTYDTDFSETFLKKYFETETDSLTVLIKNTIAWRTTCYSKISDVMDITTYTCKDEDGNEVSFSDDVANPIENTDENDKRLKYQKSDGTIVYDCTSVNEKGCLAGGKEITSAEHGTFCGNTLAINFLGFWEYLLSKVQDLVTRILPIFGKFFTDTYKEDCKERAAEIYADPIYDHNTDPEVSYTKYFDFLKNNRYYDRKPHLQHYFSVILEEEGVECLTNDVCENSLEAKGDEAYNNREEDLIEVRDEINNDILELLKNYGIEIDIESYLYEIGTGDNGTGGQGTGGDGTFGSSNSCSDNFLWPIGSNETTEENGVLFATGTPAATTITSKFGPRTSPCDGCSSNHLGLDISGAVVEGKTPIIAVADGTVVKVNNSCDNTYGCGGGYGNVVYIDHGNGIVTGYRHLNKEIVSVGQSVVRGQVIGYIGQTGVGTGVHLDFGVSTNGEPCGNPVDPLNYISAEDPRPECSDGDGFSVKETTLTKEEFVSKVKAYCSSHTCAKSFSNDTDLGIIYDSSKEYNINPEFVVIRAVLEGFSPGINVSGNYNYWGIGCTNTGGAGACYTYTGLTQGIKALANILGTAETITDVYSNNYAYLGDYWYNPGDSSLGGCYYLNSIKPYLKDTSHATKACSGAKCDVDNVNNCVETTTDEKRAYYSYQAQSSADMRKEIFGLGD